jgi:hypothetical protein
MAGVVDYVRAALENAYARITGAPKKAAGGVQPPGGAAAPSQDNAPPEARAITTTVQNTVMVSPTPGAVAVVAPQMPMVNPPRMEPMVRPIAAQAKPKAKSARKARVKKPAAKKARANKKSS